jgi:hypothetical protein
LTESIGSRDNRGKQVWEKITMERIASRILISSLPERFSFLLKSGAFLVACGAILYVALVSEYPTVHDALHNVRHALAVVPCH